MTTGSAKVALRRRQPGGDRGAAAARDPVGGLERADRARRTRTRGRGRLGSRRGSCRRTRGRRRRRPASRRATAPCSSLSARQVDGDDLARAGGDGAEHRGQADAAQADDRHALAGAHLRGVDHRADAGQHRAAEQRRLVEGQRRVDLDQRAARHDRVFGERRAAEVMVDRRAVGLRQPARAGQQRAGAVGGGAGLAQRGPAFAAGHAMAAARHEDQRDVVADREVGDAFAQLHHLAGRLVAERHRHRPRAVAVDHRQVGMAQARGADAHQHLAAAGRREFDLLDRQRLGLGVGMRQADLRAARRHGSSCCHLAHAVAQLVDEHAAVLAVVHRHGDQLHAALAECGFERRGQGVRRLDAPALRAVGLGVLDEVGVAERQAPVGEVVDRLLPADHPVGVVLDDQHDQVELQPDRGLELLRVHHEAAVAAHRQHALARVQHRGHHRRGQARAHRRQRVVEQQRVGVARAVAAREPDLVHAVVERDDAVGRHHLAHVADDALRRQREARLLGAVERALEDAPGAAGPAPPAFGSLPFDAVGQQRQARAQVADDLGMREVHLLDVGRRVADVDHLRTLRAHDERRLLDRVVADRQDQVGAGRSPRARSRARSARRCPSTTRSHLRWCRCRRPCPCPSAC